MQLSQHKSMYVIITMHSTAQPSETTLKNNNNYNSLSCDGSVHIVVIHYKICPYKTKNAIFSSSRLPSEHAHKHLFHFS